MAFVKNRVCHRIYAFGAYDVYAEVGTAPKFSRSVANAGTEDQVRKKYGSVAWTGEGNKIWVSTGHKIYADAENAALGLCAKSMVSAPETCKIGITIATGVIRVWLSDTKQISFSSGVIPPYTWEFYDENCKNKKELATCRPKYLFEVQKPDALEQLVM